MPKTKPRRNPRLLKMARLMPCLLIVPGCCNRRFDTTVACHSNLSRHGKAAARKADDCYSVWGCVACHRWLDQGPADAVIKEAAFMAALDRQAAFWRDITNDASWPQADRRAAQWALDQLENNK